MPDPPLNPRIALYSACFSRAMERDCPLEERGRLTDAMAMLVPAPTSPRRPYTNGLADLIRWVIDERLHGDP